MFRLKRLSALLLALLLAPPYRRLCALLGGRRTARCCALVLCYTGVLGMLAGAALLLGPQLTQSILVLGEHSGEYAANLQRLLDLLEARFPLPPHLLPLRQDALQNLFGWLAEALYGLFPRLLGATADFLKALLQLALGLFFSIYFLTDGSCRYFIDNKTYSLSCGDFVVIPPGIIHKVIYEVS